MFASCSESRVTDIHPAGDCPPLRLPLLLCRVSAGFPSPAEDYVECSLDLNEHLVKHPAATFFVRVAGTSMVGAGIHPGDLLIVDRSLKPAAGQVVVAAVDGLLLVKRLRLLDGRMTLVSENHAFPPVPLHDGVEVCVWGVVTAVVHKP